MFMLYNVLQLYLQEADSEQVGDKQTAFRHTVLNSRRRPTNWLNAKSYFSVSVMKVTTPHSTVDGYQSVQVNCKIFINCFHFGHFAVAELMTMTVHVCACACM